MQFDWRLEIRGTRIDGVGLHSSTSNIETYKNRRIWSVSRRSSSNRSRYQKWRQIQGSYYWKHISQHCEWAQYNSWNFGCSLISHDSNFIQPLLIPHIFPALRHLVYLCHQRWWSYRNIRFIRHVPILFLASLRDELVPPSHMAKLYKAAETSGPKVWCEFKNGTHNDTCMQVRYFCLFIHYFAGSY